MLRLDAHYLYETGGVIHPLDEMQTDDNFQDWWLRMYIAQARVEQLLSASVFRLKTSQAAGKKLFEMLAAYTGDPQRGGELSGQDVYAIGSALREFESVLRAELALMDIYLVIKKRGYDTSDLINNGHVLFPDDLPQKAPDAIADITQGCRCIAFELPTAAAFHLHRANETVLHRYYDVVMNGAPRPTGRNIGDYLAKMKDAKAGDPPVLSSLKDLKDLHRNPLIHPEHSLDSVDDAIALLGGIQSVMVHMLKALPLPSTLASNVPSGPASLNP